MNDFTLPNFNKMNDDELKMWIGSLTTPVALAHLPQLSQTIQERFGDDARLLTSTFQAPKIVYLIEDTV